MQHQNYLPRTQQLMRSFNRAISRIHPILITRYGEEANLLIQKSRQFYADLIPHIPFIGENNPLLDLFYFPASQHLAIYKAFQENGKTVEEAGQVVYEIGEAEIKIIPALGRRMIKLLWFSTWFTKRLQKRAALSQERKYPGAYVVAYHQGDGKAFDYQFDYLECAVLNFLPAAGRGGVGPIHLRNRQNCQRAAGMGVTPDDDTCRWQ